MRGRRGSNVAFAVRGRVGDESFLIGLDRAAAQQFPRLKVEGHLLDEARSIIRRMRQAGVFDWEAHHFRMNEEFHVWEKTLTPTELSLLMQD
ncbi:MAG: hypothetical protein ACYTEZ_17090 [Planctomycetota bacterium]